MSEHNSKRTRDHETIRRWTEDRGGRPASVRGTGASDAPGVLRIDFEETEPDDGLEPLEWEDFFEKFDQAGLTFLYREETDGGGLSRFNKFVYEETGRKAGPAEQGREGRGSSAEEPRRGRRGRGDMGR